MELARKELEILQSALRSATDQASQILGRPVDESVTNELRLIVEQFQASREASQNAQSRYEKMLADERVAMRAGQDAEHKRQLILSQIDSIDQQIAGCQDGIADLDEVLQGAPPLQEITSRLKISKPRSKNVTRSKRLVRTTKRS